MGLNSNVPQKDSKFTNLFSQEEHTRMSPSLYLHQHCVIFEILFLLTGKVKKYITLFLFIFPLAGRNVSKYLKTFYFFLQIYVCVPCLFFCGSVHFYLIKLTYLFIRRRYQPFVSHIYCRCFSSIVCLTKCPDLIIMKIIMAGTI